MGTRHLIAVQIDGEYKVAQYGQWDGYPSGQGATVLGFLKSWDREKFEKKLRAASFLDEAETDALNDRIKKEFPNGSWQRNWPELTRDTGAEILEIVQNKAAGIKLKNSIEFSADSLSCEYGYVIDLDSNRLEVYKGFNQVPVEAGHRFEKYTKELSDHDFGGYKYFHIKKVMEYPLDKLPTIDQMEKDVDPPEVDESA